MTNKHSEIQRIQLFLSIWLGMIKEYNLENYQDINRAAEDLSRRLLNLLYGYELKDLNTETKNFPGLDLGDRTKSLLGFQVTSTNTARKLEDTLTKVVQYGHDKIFTNGVRMLILNSERFKGWKRKKKPSDILPGFDLSKHILTQVNLIEAAREVYDRDPEAFNSVLLLLEQELIPKVRAQAEKKPAPLRPGGTALYEAATKKGDRLPISADLMVDDLSVPDLRPSARRSALVEKMKIDLEEHDLLWIVGEPSTGKTSVAVLLIRALGQCVLWFDNRDVPASMVVEHILSAMVGHFNLKPGKDFPSTLQTVLDHLAPATILVLNDLPIFHEYDPGIKNFGRFVRAAQSRNISIVVTSNHAAATVLTVDWDLDIHQVSMPRFMEEDTKEVLAGHGADKDQIDLLAGVITDGADGHPLLIQAGARYLRAHNWSIDETKLQAIFTGRYGESVERDIAGRILNTTVDPATRELLYRLSHVVGSFTMETVQTVAGVAPIIDRPTERLREMADIWIQPNESTFQVSPLVRRLSSTVGGELKRDLYEVLGREVLRTSFLSPFDASTAIFYFRQAGNNMQAAVILQQLLVAFVGKPQLFFDWALTLHWYSAPIPEEVPNFFRVQIRALQLEFTMKMERDDAFLAQDLESIMSRQDIPPIARAIGDMALSHFYSKKEPLKAIGLMAAANEELKRAEVPLSDGLDGIPDEMRQAIWYVFMQLKTPLDFREWFRIFKQIGIEMDRTAAYTDESYRLACVSIYRNLLKIEETQAGSMLSVLDEVIAGALECGLDLMAAYGIKYKIKYLASVQNDVVGAEGAMVLGTGTWARDPLFQFLVFSELGTWVDFEGQATKAREFLSAISQIEVPDSFTERLDYLITQFKVNYPGDPGLSAHYSREALRVALSGKYMLIDQVKLYGEAATGEMLFKRWATALELLADGYLLLLDNFMNDSEQQAMVIRFGSAVSYLTQMLGKGNAPKYEQGEFTIPLPGHFYRTNDALLADGSYFEERLFINAVMIQDGFELLGLEEDARFWAYRSISLSSRMDQLKYGIMLIKVIFFPVWDRNYRQAYALLNYLEKWIRNTRTEVLTDNKEGNLAGALKAVEDSDISFYYIILLPATFRISLDVIRGELLPEGYEAVIATLFDPGKYEVQDLASYSLAKKIYEAILVECQDYSAVNRLIEGVPGPHQSAIRAMAYILLATFATAKDAANLHLAIIMPLEMAMRLSPSAHRFGLIPYFIQFWEWMAEAHPGGISTVAHMRSKGWGMVRAVPWDKKLPKLFMVVAHHLDIEPDGLAAQFIDGADRAD